MPSTLTHYLFNNNLVKDDKYREIFLLGGQGADVFFFYGYNIAKRENTKEIRKFGFNIHAINPDKLYMKMLEYTFTKTGEEHEVLINFVRGFMYHYALDRNVHPYVFYNTGFPYTNSIYNRNHGNFESIMDTLLMKEYNCHKSTRSVLKAPNKHIKICSKMFSYIDQEIFNENLFDEESYFKAYKDFRFVRLCIDSRFGVKKAIFNTFLKNTSINTASQPKKVKDDDIYDYLNRKNKEWVFPCTGEVKTDSVKELFKKAELDCRIIDNIIYNYKNNIVTQRKLTKFTNNINHDGRDLDKFMTYFKIIWNIKK